jgi:hypothetical protein
MKDLSLQIYEIISDARNEKIKWKVLGLENYSTPDKEQTLAEIAVFGQPPSKTLKKLIYMDMANNLTDIPPTQMDDIKAEIEGQVDSMSDEEVQHNPSALMANKQAMAALEVKATSSQQAPTAAKKKPANSKKGK